MKYHPQTILLTIFSLTTIVHADDAGRQAVQKKLDTIMISAFAVDEVTVAEFLADEDFK